MRTVRGIGLAAEISSGSLVSVYNSLGGCKQCFYWYQVDRGWQHRQAPKSTLHTLWQTKQILNRIKHGRLTVYGGSSAAAEEVWELAAALEYYTAAKQDKCPKCSSEAITHNETGHATGECSACNIYWDEK